MSYILNSTAMASPVFVPASVVDSNLKLASHTQLKVLLVFLRNMTSGNNSEENISSFLNLPLSEVNDALEFWAQAGILVSTANPQKPETNKTSKPKTVKSVSVKPTREEVAEVALSDPKLSFLLGEAEMKLARGLRSNELQTFAWLYLDYQMDVSLILMLVEYAVSEGKATVSFIEKTALAWIDAGVTTLAQAEEQIEERNRKKTAWNIVRSAFGIDPRLPSDKELEYSDKWVCKWKFSREMLKEAYNRCIDQKAKISMPYINSILEKWFKEGITSLTEIAQDKKTAKESSFAKYDRSFVEKLLNSDD